jgi:predicted nucleic acid-binding protein
MTGLLFVDTNVLVYSLDPVDPEKRDKAAALLISGSRRHALVTSPQTLSECYRVITTKRCLMTTGAARDFISMLAPSCTAPLDHRTLELAWKIEDMMHYSWWDCVMLGAALRAGCELFATEDLSHDQIIGGMRIINPFHTDIEMLFQSN